MASQEFDDRSAEEGPDGESDEEEGDEEGGGQLLVALDDFGAVHERDRGHVPVTQSQEKNEGCVVQIVLEDDLKMELFSSTAMVNHSQYQFRPLRR